MIYSDHYEEIQTIHTMTICRTVSRTVPARAPARQTATGIAQFAGDNSVSISTPDFQIEY